MEVTGTVGHGLFKGVAGGHGVGLIESTPEYIPERYISSSYEPRAGEEMGLFLLTDFADFGLPLFFLLLTWVLREDIDLGSFNVLIGDESLSGLVEGAPYACGGLGEHSIVLYSICIVYRIV